MTREELLQWIDYYEQGEELEDDTLKSIFALARREVELTSVREHAIKWQREASDLQDENQAEFEESDCSEAMHAVAEYERVVGFLGQKIGELPEFP